MVHCWKADTVRLIKMTDAMLKVGEDRNLTLDEFFKSMKGDRNGVFLVPKGWIGEGGLERDEAVLFSHKGEVKYVARAASGREDNHGRDSDRFPYRFRMDPASVRRVRFGLDELQGRFESAGVKVNLKGRGWTKIDETPGVRKLFEEISGSGSPV